MKESRRTVGKRFPSYPERKDECLCDALTPAPEEKRRFDDAGSPLISTLLSSCAPIPSCTNAKIAQNTTSKYCIRPSSSLFLTPKPRQESFVESSLQVPVPQIWEPRSGHHRACRPFVQERAHSCFTPPRAFPTCPMMCARFRPLLPS